MIKEEQYSSNRWKELAGIKENKDYLYEDNLELFVGASGLIFSGILTSLIYGQGLKVFNHFKKFSDDVNNQVDNFKKNMLQKDYEQQKKILKILKDVSSRFSHDEQMIQYFEQMRKYMNNEDQYSKDKKEKILKNVENYIISKLSSEEKKYLSLIVKFITNDF